MSSWYPCKPPEEIPLNNIVVTEDMNSDDQIKDGKPFWETEKLKFTNVNKWHSIPREIVASARRTFVKGVEVRRLPKDHVLHGECGLFATQKFSKFDVIGEYTGKVVDNGTHGHYVAALEDKPTNDESLGLDAEYTGNEMRFINSYLNVAFQANVTMRTVYISSYPHIVIVCMEDLYPGDEILLDYGEAYNNAYLRPQKPIPQSEASLNLTSEEMLGSLPYCDEDM